MNIIRSIQNSIYEIRGERVLLDKDLDDLRSTHQIAQSVYEKEYKTVFR